MSVLAENISKLKSDGFLSRACHPSFFKSQLFQIATHAAGVWPPPQIYDNIKLHCQSVLKAVKQLLSAFETVLILEISQSLEPYANLSFLVIVCNRLQVEKGIERKRNLLSKSTIGKPLDCKSTPI